MCCILYVVDCELYNLCCKLSVASCMLAVVYGSIVCCTLYVVGGMMKTVVVCCKLYVAYGVLSDILGISYVVCYVLSIVWYML